MTNNFRTLDTGPSKEHLNTHVALNTKYMLRLMGEKKGRFTTNWNFDLICSNIWTLLLGGKPRDHSSCGKHECLSQIVLQSIQCLSRYFTKKEKCQPHCGFSLLCTRAASSSQWVWNEQSCLVQSSRARTFSGAHTHTHTHRHTQTHTHTLHIL